MDGNMMGRQPQQEPMQKRPVGIKVFRLDRETLPELPKCDLSVSWQTRLQRRAWNKNGYGPHNEKTCDRNATYKVDGMRMCRMHAAYYVLDKVLSDGK